jgi:small conductance mechanosensitive channel
VYAPARWSDWQQRLIKEPVVAGVQELGESSVNVRLMMDTQPGKQWEVRRELLRRVKNRFDEEGIEIPFPQRTLHIRKEVNEPS